MGSFYRGYRAGRAAAEREQRKADYTNSRIHAEKEFRAENGRDWTQNERLQFDRNWRMIHLDLPRSPFSDTYELWFFISCVVLLLIVIPSMLALDGDRHELSFAAVLFAAVILKILRNVYRYRQTCKLIEQIGEKAWREQEIQRQEEMRIEPWEVNEKVQWK